MNTFASPAPVPVSELDPCGPSLEYDHEFAVLLARMVPRTDAQYGSFVGAAEVPNWAEIERDCRRLLLRSQDINLLVWLCRARTRLAQANGLAQALGALSRVLYAWPDAVHPQIVLDGEREPSVRANALAALADADGLLGDVLEVVVVHGTALRLTVRDVERAFAIPPALNALSPQAVTLQIATLRTAARSQADAPINGLAEAARHLLAIDAWARSQLGDDAPSLAPLAHVLQLFAGPAVGTSAVTAAAHVSPVPAHVHTQTLAREPHSRADALNILRDVRGWFERHEPSSPVAVLLKQAERLVGKRFAEVADCIPPDILQKWDATTEAGEGV